MPLAAAQLPLNISGRCSDGRTGFVAGLAGVECHPFGYWDAYKNDPSHYGPLRAPVVVAGQRHSAKIAHSLTVLFASSGTRMDWNCNCKACCFQLDFILGFGISICNAAEFTRKQPEKSIMKFSWNMFYHVLTDIWYTFRIDLHNHQHHQVPKKASSQAQLLSTFRESPRPWAHVNWLWTVKEKNRCRMSQWLRWIICSYKIYLQVSWCSCDRRLRSRNRQCQCHETQGLCLDSSWVDRSKSDIVTAQMGMASTWGTHGATKIIRSNQVVFFNARIILCGVDHLIYPYHVWCFINQTIPFVLTSFNSWFFLYFFVI